MVDSMFVPGSEVSVVGGVSCTSVGGISSNVHWGIIIETRKWMMS